jgi:hypothetical protein
MTTIFSSLKEITPEEFKRATDVTDLGTVYGTMAAHKRMEHSRPGTYRAASSALKRSVPFVLCGAIATA